MTGSVMRNRTANKVRCGVIGAGWWGTYAHIPALLEHPDAELAAVQTRVQEEALKVAHDFGIPHAYSSWEELLEIETLDAVVVCSTPNLHYKQAFAALQKGLHVLVEKPMTFTAAQARELVSLAAENGRQLLISAPWHYTRHGQQARQMIAAGQLGNVRLISILMTNPVAHLIRGAGAEPTHAREEPYLKPLPGTYGDPKIAGGGQIYTQVSHVAAYLTFLTDARPSQVFARFHNDGASMDIYDALNIQMENDCLVSVASTGATSIDRRDFEARIYGTEGILFLELWQGSMKFVPLDGSAGTDFPHLSPNEIYPERAPARNLIDCANNPEANLSPGTLGLAAMEVIEAASQSAQSGKNITIRPLQGTSE
jgi:predicted dehydrogenase